MNEIDGKLIGTLVIGIVGSILTAVRRFENKDKNAGMGVAGWTIFIIFWIWTS